jgi:hypothetical protein
MKSFIACTLCEEIKVDEMGWECSAFGSHKEDPGFKGRIILTLIL